MGSTAARRGLWILVLITAAVGLYLERDPVLTRAGSALVRSDPLAPADAIVILAGETPLREIEAADLYLAKYAPRVLLTLETDEQALDLLRARGIPFESDNERRATLVRLLGVPDSAVTWLDDARATSTKSEAELVRNWVVKNRARRIIIVTSSYHTTRASMIFRCVLRDLDVQVLARPAARDPFRPDGWWRDRDQLRNGVFEWQKLLFYYAAYR
jgi:uncharacterized SAM-binding protein YcdF (DUF218 family)